MVWYQKYVGVVNALLLSSCAALLLYLARYVATGSVQFSFMAWNLFLSLSAVVAGVLFVKKWQVAWRPINVVLFVLWLLLLPNTFYMLTDFLHVQETGDINLLFDIVLVGLFAMNGFLHGIVSLLLVHRALLKMYSSKLVTPAITLIILASSFAVDMGRYLRWNSWDVFQHPFALLFDVTNMLTNPTSYDRSFLITGIFFVAISSLYAVAWQLTTIQWNNNGTHHTKHK